MPTQSHLERNIPPSSSNHSAGLGNGRLHAKRMHESRMITRVMVRATNVLVFCFSPQKPPNNRATRQTSNPADLSECARVRSKSERPCFSPDAQGHTTCAPRSFSKLPRVGTTPTTSTNADQDLAPPRASAASHPSHLSANQHVVELMSKSVCLALAYVCRINVGLVAGTISPRLGSS